MENTDYQYVDSSEVMKILSISSQNLYNYKKTGKIESTKNGEGKELFSLDDVLKIAKESRRKGRADVIFLSAWSECDVSGLERRYNLIKQHVDIKGLHCTSNYIQPKPDYSMSRPNIQFLLFNQVFNYEIADIFVWDKRDISDNPADFDFFEKICNRFGTRVVIASEDFITTKEEEDNADYSRFSDILRIPYVTADKERDGFNGYEMKLFIDKEKDFTGLSAIYFCVEDFCEVCGLRYTSILDLLKNEGFFVIYHPIEREDKIYLTSGAINNLIVTLCTDYGANFSNFLDFYHSTNYVRVSIFYQESLKKNKE